jgi:tetratricopeptide (TPR) repeat protein
MGQLRRALAAALVLPTLVAASVVALEAAEGYPILDGPPSLAEAIGGRDFAFAAWCNYLGGMDTRELLSEVEGRPPIDDADSAASLAELEGLLHQGLGEYAEAFRCLARLVELQPDRAESLVYLRRLVELAEEFPGGPTDLESLCRSLADDGSIDPAVRAEALGILVESLRASGHPEGTVEATRLTRDLGYLRFFSYLGPFDNTGEAGFMTPYGPELDGRVNLDARYPGKRIEIGWRGFPQPHFTLSEDPGLGSGWGGERSVNPFYGPLQLSAITRPNYQVCGYLASWVRLDERTEVVFSLGAVGSFKLWLDGAEVLSVEGYRSWAHPDTFRAGVVLEPGWHEVLVKTCCDVGGWEVYLRTRDRRGEPLPLEHRATPPPGWHRPKEAPETFAPEPDPYARLEALAEGGNVLALYYLGHLEAQERRADLDERLHRELFSRAVTRSRSFRPSGAVWAPVAYSYALYEEKFNPAKFALAEALEADPHNVESCIGLADAYYRLQRPDEVDRYVELGLGENPDCLRLLHLKGKVLAEREYQLERKAVLLRMRSIHPDYGPLLEELASYSLNRVSVGERIDIFRRLLEKNALDSSAYGRLANLLVDLGRGDEAVELLKRARPLDPYSLWSLAFTARLYFDRGDYEGAVGVLNEATSVCPEEAELLALAGQAAYELGRADEAQGLWDTALAVQPNLTWVDEYRRTLATAEQKSDFDEPYSYDAYALVDAFEPMDPDASAEVLLDQKVLKVNADGTTSEVVHRVIALVTEDALQDFGWGYFGYVPNEQTYEVRHMRVIRGDGTETEAADWSEYSASDPEARMYYDSVTRYAPLPGIEPGAFIDVEYRIDDVGENIYQGHFSDTFIFGNHQPTHIAEYVVIAPKGYGLQERGWNGAPEPEVEEDERTRVRRWTLTDIGRIVEEPAATPLIEILPFTVVSSFAEWRELGRWWWQLSKDTLTPTPQIRELADTIIEGAGAETVFEKITAIYDYVTKKLRYVAILLGIGGWKPAAPESTVHTGYGDCKASAALMVSLFKAAGIEAYPVLIRTRDRGGIEWDQAALGLFNHMICAVPFQRDFDISDVRTKLQFSGEEEFGEFLFLDGTTDFHTWWELPPGDQGVEAYVCTPEGGFFAKTPLYTADSNFIYSRTDFVLDATGDAVGHRELDYGARLSPERRADNQQVEMQEVDLEVYWNRRYPGTDVYNVDISDVTDTGDNVHYAYDLQVPGLARREGTRLVFATHVHRDLYSQRFGSLTSRVYPLRLDYRFLQNTRTSYVLPEGFIPLSLPEPVEVSLTTSTGSVLARMSVSYDFSPSVLTVTDELRVDAAVVDVEDYPAFRSFLAAYDRVQAQVVLVGPGD